MPGAACPWKKMTSPSLADSPSLRPWKKWLNADFVERRGRGEGRDVAADAFLGLVGAHHHRRGIPADEALDPALEVGAAGHQHLFVGRDRVDVGGVRGKGELDAVLPGVNGELFEQPGDLCRAAALQHIIKRVEPLSCFGGVELRRVFRCDVSHGSEILSARRKCRRPVANHQLYLGFAGRETMRRQTVALTCVALPLAGLISLARGSPEGLRDERRTAACVPEYRPPGRRAERSAALQGCLAAQTAGAQRRGRSGRARSQDRSVHRLLPVRLRRLDREEPGARRSARLRTLHGSAGSQLRHPAPHPRSAGARRAIARKAADYYAACMDESKIEAAGLARDRPRPRRRSRSSLNPDDLPVLVAHLHSWRAGPVPLRRRRPTRATPRSRLPASIRAASRCPIATTT